MFRLGDVEIVRVEESQGPGFQPNQLLPDWNAEALSSRCTKGEDVGLGFVRVRLLHRFGWSGDRAFVGLAHAPPARRRIAPPFLDPARSLP